MRTAAAREPGLPTRIQILVDLAGGFARLASLSGLSHKALSDWARSIREPHPAQVVRLAEGCGVDPTWLRTGDGDAPKRVGPVVQVSSPAGPPRASELAEAIDLAVEDVPPTAVVLTALGAGTVLSVDPDWANSIGLGGGGISWVCTDRTASPIVQVGQPVLAAPVYEPETALALNPDSVWVVSSAGRILLRRIQATDSGVVLSTIGAEPRNEITTPDAFRILGRAEWSGVRL
ncbi:helix-turn-helix domain-containing protein [Geothrix sp. PMB-07]|uniref:helix-turn-helix domain-containing protein n=1 Tax=Geothrix sp. PMB-07 TaxID=3068640 RepID=UPI00355774F3